MSIAGILGTIEAECEAAIADIQATALADANRIRDDARRSGEAERDARSTRRDSEADLESARIVNGARLVAERRLRDAREALYQRARERMMEQLAHVRSQPDYPELMLRLISEAQAVLPDAATLVVDPRDLDVTRDVAEHMGIPMTVIATIHTLGGAELVGDDGRRVSNTLDARAEKAAAFLRNLAVEQIPELGGG